MEHLRVSTITSILKISDTIDLQKVYDCIPISTYILFIEYGSENEPKGFSEKSLKKKRKKKKKKIFYNQITLHVMYVITCSVHAALLRSTFDELQLFVQSPFNP